MLIIYKNILSERYTCLWNITNTRHDDCMYWIRQTCHHSITCHHTSTNPSVCPLHSRHSLLVTLEMQCVDRCSVTILSQFVIYT